jgi:hypothetical protein
LSAGLALVDRALRAGWQGLQIRNVPLERYRISTFSLRPKGYAELHCASLAKLGFHQKAVFTKRIASRTAADGDDGRKLLIVCGSVAVAADIHSLALLWA